jgi:aspartyl-tRNA(Asn)/glutamyl-tRNA(Gln) amidotransferase subunit B
VNGGETPVNGLEAHGARRLSLEPVIGLEIHAQLLTRTKIFCGCSTAFGAPPNTHVCPVCLGLPGVLPVLNRRAVDLAVQTALALGCDIQPISIFARKNYFYPDLPKGYQISQYDRPLAEHGRVTLQAGDRRLAVGIVRLHLEEDAGKSLHEVAGGDARLSSVDFNRAGVPLAEIVTAPDLASGADAAWFFERLRAMLVALGVNDGNMEEGSLRCDANVSVRPAGATALGVKTEIKNLNSFRFLQKALEFEIARQAGVIGRGGRVLQETRLWDAAAGRTVSMRSKEEAHDYRYFPEPDLPPLRVDAAWIATARAGLPELPEARKARFVEQYGLPEYDAAWLTTAAALGDYFEAASRASGQPKATSNWMMGELARAMNERQVPPDAVPIRADALGELVRLAAESVVTGPVARQVFERMWDTGRRAGDLIDAEKLASVTDEGAVLAAVRGVLASQADAVTQYRAGKSATFGFLVGQVMRATGGKADPKVVTRVLKQELDS